MKFSLLVQTLMLAALTACSGNGAVETLAKVPGFGNLAVEQVVLDPNTLAAIDQIGNNERKAINVIRIDRNAGLDLIEIARKGNRSTYTSATRRSIVLKEGVIVQTQGIGGDLATSQHETYDLRNSGTVFTKTHSYLGGDNQIQSVAFRCVRQVRPTDFFGLREKRRLLTPVDEVCSNKDQTHQNIYFLYPNTGTVFRSRQWVSDQIGYLRVEQILLPSP
jgi:hypothetical protein